MTRSFFTKFKRDRIHWYWSGRFWYAGLVSSHRGWFYRVCGAGSTQRAAMDDMLRQL